MNLDEASELFVNIESFKDVVRWHQLQHGHIYCYSSIDDLSAPELVMQLNYLHQSKHGRPIIIHLNSGGGDIYAALAIHDTIKWIQTEGTPVHVLVEGLCGSAAAMYILPAADVRIATKYSRFLFHELRDWKQGTEKLSDRKDRDKELDALEEYCQEILGKTMNRKKASVYKLYERKEYWFGAEEALELSLIQKIL